MPIYNYKCEVCGHIFSVLKDINDSSDVKCEKCGGKTKKLISKVAVRFNAPGFYSTTISNANTHNSKSSESKENKKEIKKSAVKKEG